MATVRYVTVQYQADTTQLEQSRDVIRQISRELDMTEDEIRGINREFNEQTGIIGRLRQEERRLVQLREQSNDPDEVRRYNREIRNTQREMRNLTGETESTGNSFKSLGKIIGGVLAVSTIKNFVVGAVELGAQMESLEIQFEQFTGSASGAKEVLSDIEEFAASTPFQFDTLATAGRNLLAFGVEVDNVLPNLRKLGDIAAGSGNDIGEIAELFGKAKVQGRLFAEDINQFLGRGIPIVKGLAETLGVTEQEVKSLVSEGKVGFGELEGAIESLAGETGQYFGLTQRLAESTSGRLSTLKDNWDSIRRTIGEALLPVISDAVDGINKLITGQSILNEISADEAFALVSRNTKFLGENIDLAREQIEKWKQEFGLTNFEAQKFLNTLSEVDIVYGDVDATIENVRGELIKYVAAQKSAGKETTKTTSTISNQGKQTQKATEDLGRYIVELNELIEQEQKVIERVFDPAQDGIDLRTEKVAGEINKYKDLYDGLFAFVEQEQSATGEAIAELLQDSFEKIGPAVAAGFEIASNLSQAFFARQESELEAQKQRELELYGTTEDRKQAINDKFAKKEDELRRKQAQQAKRLAVFETIINTAAAIVKALPNIPLSLLAAATGASQLAVIQAQSFAKGVIGLEGPGTGTSDDIPAFLSRGESVMTAKETKMFRPTLEAIRKGGISPMLLNDFVRGNIMVTGGRTNNADVVAELKGLKRSIKGLQIHNVVLDENGFSRFISSQDTYRHFLNKLTYG